MNFSPDDTKTQFATPPEKANGPLARFVQRNFRPAGAPLLLCLALATGLCSGVAAWLFKGAISWMSTTMTSHLHMDGGNPKLILVPLIGICLCGLFMRKVLKVNISNGTDQIKAGLSKGHYYLRPRRIITPLIASTLTLGFGGSAGGEGPIASSGAAIGSNLGRIFGVDPKTVGTLVAIGAGAGIAAIFKAPIGGMFFVIECLAVTLTATDAVALGVACVAGGLTAYALSGGHPDVDYLGTITFEPRMLFVAVLLGIVCGLYSLYYSWGMGVLGRYLRGLNRPWVRNVTGGLVLGFLLFLFPSLYGEGYAALSHIVNGIDSTVIDGSPFATFAEKLHTGPLAIVVLGIMLAKCWACSATVHSGGVAGEFAPTLFAGAMTGLFFGLIANAIPGVAIPTAHCALFGMAGAMAGIIRAPFMAIFIATEMTGSYASMLPIAICAVVSYFVVWMIRRQLSARHTAKAIDGNEKKS